MNYGGGSGRYGDDSSAPAPSSSTSASQLNPEQLQHLLNKVSSDEQKELQDILKRCTSEVMFTRGLPFSTLVLGSLYFARTRLPKQYHFGPKGWPFYAIMGIGSLTAANIFGMGMCKERINPKIQELWNKYQLDESRTSYEALRAQNRQRYGSAATAGPSAETAAFEPSQAPPPLEPYAARSRTPQQRFVYEEEQPVFMSGTPMGEASAGRAFGTGGGAKKTNQYGDEDFS